MIFRIPAGIFFFLIIFITGCSTVTMDYNYDPGYDFADLKSFNWFPVPRENIRYELLEKTFKHRLAEQLAEKQYRMTADNPDILIAMHGEYQPWLDYEEWQYLYANYREYWKKRRIDIMGYSGDQLIVDFIDSRSKDIVYRATVNTFVLDSKQERRERMIDDAVMKIIGNFPPTDR